MALGDYVLARQALSKAEWLFQQYNTPNNLAAVHLRIAAVVALRKQGKRCTVLFDASLSPNRTCRGIQRFVVCH
jgi:hypothetical protein